MRIKISSVIWFLWLGIVLLAPLTMRTSSEGIAGGVLPYTLWTDFLFGILVLVMAIRGDLAVVRFPASLKVQKVQFAFILLFVLHYLSILLSGLGGGSVLTYILSGSYWIQAMLAYLVAQRLVTGESEVRSLRRVFILAFCIVGTVGVMEILRFPGVVGFLNSNYGTETQIEAARHLADIGQFRITSTFDRNPHGLALFSMMALAWMTSLLVVGGRRTGGRVVPIALICLSTVMLLGTLSSLGLAAAAAAVLSIVFSRPKNRLITAVLVIAMLGTSVYFLQSRVSSSSLRELAVVYKMLTTGERGPSSFTDRAEVWVQIVRLVRSSAADTLFGVSYGEAKAANEGLGISADSDYMFMLLYKGVTGLGAFLLMYYFMWTALRRALRNLPKGCPEREVLLLTARGILIGMMVAGLAGGFMSGGSTAWRTAFVVYTLVGASLGVQPVRRDK